MKVEDTARVVIRKRIERFSHRRRLLLQLHAEQFVLMFPLKHFIFFYSLGEMVTS